MRITSILLILAVSSTATSANWFIDTISSGYTYLKTGLFGEDKFALEGGHELHQKLSKEFVRLKDDGLSLAYNLIYYNFAMNLHRECLVRAGWASECTLFADHIKNVITKNVEVNGDKGYNYPLLGDFYTAIFDENSIDKKLDANLKQELKETLIELNKHFEGRLFASAKEKLTNKYNSLIKKLMDYVYNKANVAPRALGEARPESGWGLDPLDFRY
jgi:hypothetical protein